jgi:hypothetical protein
VSTVPQSSVFKSPEFTRVNDICFVEIEGQYRKGKIIFIGKLLLTTISLEKRQTIFRFVL